MGIQRTFTRFPRASASRGGGSDGFSGGGGDPPCGRTGASPFDRALQCIVTCFYVGYLPGAPGTYASAIGCVVIYFFPSIFSNIFFCIGLVLFSILCIHFFTYDGKDPGYIVIDELAGICVALAGHSITPVNTVIGFVLFRIFDITKPFPIKQSERLRGAYGIVADDVLAGIFANIILVLAGLFL